MKIHLDLRETGQGYVAYLDCLPEFSVAGQTPLDLLTDFPSAIKTYIYNWERTVLPMSEKYQKEIPYVKRIKSRGFYQSTVHRFQDIFRNLDIAKIDIEHVHCMQRNEFEESLSVSC